MNLMRFNAIFGVAYLFLVALMPYVSFAGQKIRIELLLLFPMLILVLANYKTIVSWRAGLSLVSVFLLFIVALFSVISVMSGCDLNLIGLFFYLRYFVLIVFVAIIAQAIKCKGKYWTAVVVALSTASIMQFFGFDWFLTLIAKFYTSPTRTSGLAGLSHLSASGFSLRSYGFLESPTWSGVFFGISFYYSNFQKNLLGIVCMVASLIGGLLSLSSSFFALLFVALAFHYWNAISLKSTIAIGLTCILAMIVAVDYLDEVFLGAFAYQINRLVTLSVFDSRYSDSGNIGANFSLDFFGNGAIIEVNRFIGDSLYLVLLHDFGVFFTIVFLAYLLYAFFKIGGQRGVIACGLLLIAGIGSPSFFSPRIADLFLLAAAIGRGEK